MTFTYLHAFTATNLIIESIEGILSNLLQLQLMGQILQYTESLENTALSNTINDILVDSAGKK